MFITPKFSQPSTPKPQYWPDKDYPLNGGLDLEGTEFELPENKTNKSNKDRKLKNIKDEEVDQF